MTTSRARFTLEGKQQNERISHGARSRHEVSRLPSLTPQRKAKLVEALSIGTSIETAYERARIVKDTFYCWMREGKALLLDEESSDIPLFLPRQPDESDDKWLERKYLFDWECALLEELYLACKEVMAEAKFKAHERMWDRVMNDDDYVPNGWILERRWPEEYALVTTNRRQVDVKAEITQKHEVEALAEALAILGPANPALIAGKQTVVLLESDAVVIEENHD